MTVISPSHLLHPVFLTPHCIPLTSAPSIAPPSPHLWCLGLPEVPCSVLQKELKIVNVGRDAIHSSLNPSSWWLGGDLTSHISDTTVFGHVSAPPVTSCHLMPPPPGSPDSRADLFVPQAAPPLACFSKQWDENGGNHQAYGAWALHDAGCFINCLEGLRGRVCFFVNGVSAVTGTCSNHRSTLKCISL